MSGGWSGARGTSAQPNPRGTSDAPLASDTPDRFSTVSQVRFLIPSGLVLPGQFKLWDVENQLLGQVRRDGQGLRAFLMNFAIEDDTGRPLLLIRQPAPRPGIHIGGAFTLLNGQGVQIGELFWNWKMEAKLVLGGERSFVAKVSGWTWKGFDIVSGGLRVGRGSYPNPFMPRPGQPGGVLLEFTPGASQSSDHLYLVALVAFICIFHAPPGWPR
jgi:hypothetical protein